MGHELMARGERVHLSCGEWRHTYRLGVLYGWCPPKKDPCREGWVTAADASAWADALEAALPDIPDHEAEGMKPYEKVNSFELLSGPRKEALRQVIAFFREGPFEVC